MKISGSAMSILQVLILYHRSLVPHGPSRALTISCLTFQQVSLTGFMKGWGYDIYMRKDYSGKRLKIEFYPDARIKNIITR
jgi:hypothetical protein